MAKSGGCVINFSGSIQQLVCRAPVVPSRVVGDAIGTPYLLLAEEAVRNGQTVPDVTYSPFEGLDRFFAIGESEHDEERSFDALLTLLIASGLLSGKDFSLVLDQGPHRGGPWVSVGTIDNRIQVSMVSNYSKLEHEEAWMSSAMGFFEWTVVRSGFFSTPVYRKVWLEIEDPIDLAAAISLPVLHVFDALRATPISVMTSMTHNLLLEAINQHKSVSFDVPDLTYASRIAGENALEGMPHSLSESDPQDETGRALSNVARTLDTAADSHGMTWQRALSELRERLIRRNVYEKDMIQGIRAVTDSLIDSRGASIQGVSSSGGPEDSGTKGSRDSVLTPEERARFIKMWRKRRPDVESWSDEEILLAMLHGA